MILSSVDELTDNSNHMNEFIEDRILSDYETFIQTSKQYSVNADYYKAFSDDLNITLKDLLEMVINVMKTINGVAEAASQGAEGTTEIAYQVANDKSCCLILLQIMKTYLYHFIFLLSKKDNT